MLIASHEYVAHTLFFFKLTTAYQIRLSLVCSEMCIRDTILLDIYTPPPSDKKSLYWSETLGVSYFNSNRKTSISAFWDSGGFSYSQIFLFVLRGFLISQSWSLGSHTTHSSPAQGDALYSQKYQKKCLFAKRDEKLGPRPSNRTSRRLKLLTFLFLNWFWTLRWDSHFLSASFLTAGEGGVPLTQFRALSWYSGQLWIRGSSEF